MMENTYEVTVFNTITSEYEDVSVSKTVHDEYRRGEWRIQKNEEKHNYYEIPFSSLIGGKNAAYENFHEFIGDMQNPLLQLIEKEEVPDLYKAILQLNEDDRLLIVNIYLKRMSERAYAKQCGVSQPTIHRKKKRILKYLKEILH